jgi:hypothetical protein
MFSSSQKEKCPKPLIYKDLKHFTQMPQTGIEPVRCRHHRILSPARLPVPPLRHNIIQLVEWMEKDSNRFGCSPIISFV